MNNALGRPKKKKIISRVKAYHGVTIMSASLTGLPYNHIGWDLPIDRVLHTDCPHYYRFGKDGESEAEFVARCVQSLRDLIEREGPDTIAAFIAEPVMGAGGVIDPAGGLLSGDPGRARRARHHHDRRRSHQRLRPHRQLVGLPDGRHDADDHLRRQATDGGLRAARRRDGAGRRLPGLCRPFGRRSARSAMASPMADIRSAAHSASRRSRSTRSATSSVMCATLSPTFAGAHGSASAIIRWSARPASVGLIGAAELVADKKTKRSVRSQERGRPQLAKFLRGPRRDPARARRSHRLLPADDHHRGRAQRVVRPLRPRVAAGRGMGREGRLADGGLAPFQEKCVADFWSEPGTHRQRTAERFRGLGNRSTASTALHFAASRRH